MSLQTPTRTAITVCGRIQSQSISTTDGEFREVITIDIRIQAAKQIRKLRQERHWTQQYLTEITNLPGPWSVSRLETRGTDSLSTLQIICDEFGIEVWELLRDASGASEAGEQLGQGR